MPLLTSYTTGTVSVAANGTAVTGTGTSWIAAGLEEGDVFWAAGLSVRIASVNSNTSITLAFPWPGAARSGSAYEVRYTPDSQRVQASARDLISRLDGGNLTALAGLASAANKLPYFNGAGSATLADLTSFGRALINKTGANGGILVATGTGSAAVRPIVGTVGQTGGVPNDAILEEGSNASGSWVRLASGYQECRHDRTGDAGGTTIAIGSGFRSNDVTWNFPVPFISAPVVTAPSSGGNRWASASGATTTSVTFREFNFLSSATQQTVSLVAVGRWF